MFDFQFPFPSHYLPPQNSGPCNSFYCLGHFKNVYDDDDEHVYTVNNVDNRRDWCKELRSEDKPHATTLQTIQDL